MPLSRALVRTWIHYRSAAPATRARLEHDAVGTLSPPDLRAFNLLEEYWAHLATPGPSRDVVLSELEPDPEALSELLAYLDRPPTPSSRDDRRQWELFEVTYPAPDARRLAPTAERCSFVLDHLAQRLQPAAEGIAVVAVEWDRALGQLIVHGTQQDETQEPGPRIEALLEEALDLLLAHKVR